MTGMGAGLTAQLGQWMMLPFTAMWCGLDALANSVQCMQTATIADPGDPRFAALVRATGGRAGAAAAAWPSSGGAATATPATPSAASGWQRDDLEGDDLKRVRYRIDFTKPGYEALLVGDQ